jgi:hypothetical protein
VSGVLGRLLVQAGSLTVSALHLAACWTDCDGSTGGDGEAVFRIGARLVSQAIDEGLLLHEVAKYKAIETAQQRLAGTSLSGEWHVFRKRIGRCAQAGAVDISQ